MENINLLRKLAWSFHHSTGLDWDELFQEAAIGYMHAMKTYDPEKGALSTHIWYAVSAQLKRYLKAEKEYKHPLDLLDDTHHNIPSPESFFESLTDEAEIIARMVLATSLKYMNLKPVEAENRVKRILLRRGWSMNKIMKGINDLKLACNT